MSMSEAQRLIADMASDEALTRTVTARAGAENIAQEAQTAGYDVTAEDLQALKAQHASSETDQGDKAARKLSDDELDQVVGGFSFGLGSLLSGVGDLGKGLIQTGEAIGDGVIGQGHKAMNHVGNADSDFGNGINKII